MPTERNFSASKDQLTERQSAPSQKKGPNGSSTDVGHDSDPDIPTGSESPTSQQPPTLPYTVPREECGEETSAYPQPGTRFGDFDILSLLGEGAFAKVYLARQISLGRQVALKVSANRGTEARTVFIPLGRADWEAFRIASAGTTGRS